MRLQPSALSHEERQHRFKKFPSLFGACVMVRIRFSVPGAKHLIVTPAGRFRQLSDQGTAKS
jgi:hypothetical protein